MQRQLIAVAILALLCTAVCAGPLDKITDGVKGAVNSTKSAAGTVANGTKSAATTVGNTGKDAVKSVGDAGKAVGDAVKPKSAAGAASATGVVAAAGFGSLLLLGLAL